MRQYLIILLLSFLLNFSSQAHHQNEPYAFNKHHKYKIDKSENYYKFDHDLQDNELSKIVKEQIEKKTPKKSDFSPDNQYGLVSYLLYEDGKIKIDHKRKSKYKKGYYPSHSVGKSLVGLITGYAVCEGYINHTIFDRIDYPTVAGTLYENQRLIDLLNMTAGDQYYLGEMWGGWDSRMNSDGKSINTIPIKTAMKRYFKDSKPARGFDDDLQYNYSAMTTNVLINYIIYITGNDWKKLLEKVFTKDAKVKNRVYFHKTLYVKDPNRKGEYGRYSFYAQRDDYLRIGLMVMNHWNNDTCVGKYLKTIYENRVKKNRGHYSLESASQYSESYGGQFHFDILRLQDKKILAMDGFGGQQLIIDFDKKRIIAITSEDRHYDWKNIVHEVLKK